MYYDPKSFKYGIIAVVASIAGYPLNVWVFQNPSASLIVSIIGIVIGISYIITSVQSDSWDRPGCG
jgi:hypothetical protein